MVCPQPPTLSPIRRQTLAGPSTGQGIFSHVFLLLSASPGRLVRPWRSGRSGAANGMTFFQEMMLSIAIATFAVGLGNLIWSALAALW
jgi:hypothetical protein